MSHPTYPNALPVSAVIERLAEASTSSFHEFWADDVSLLDAAISIPTRIHGPRQITDLYLLALAVRHDGQFVTFDAVVAMNAIKGADKRHLVDL
jgi:predicted nucleic acid-binding protein